VLIEFGRHTGPCDALNTGRRHLVLLNHVVEQGIQRNSQYQPEEKGSGRHLLYQPEEKGSGNPKKKGSGPLRRGVSGQPAIVLDPGNEAAFLRKGQAPALRFPS
jgi:hypothetical protein